jgi:hypothetical protein
VLLTPAPSTLETASLAMVLPRLRHVDLRQADDGWHGSWQVNGVTHQFWLVEAPPDEETAYVVTLPLDALFELRVHSARRFWRNLNGRSPGAPFRAMPDQLRQFHTLSLRALDARLAGESYRGIAEALLGFRGDKTDWESDPRKNKGRRLVAAGLRMMRGGYRDLLHYPIKLRRR